MTTVHVEGGWLRNRPTGLACVRQRASSGWRSWQARERLNGCAAAAYAALYANVNVITAYPIRPYTAIMMNLAQFIADGILDAEYITADGEHSQLRPRSAPDRAGRAPTPGPPASALRMPTRCTRSSPAPASRSR